jgi:hypothetical protein
MKFLGQIKRHEGLEKRIMKGYLPGSWKRGGPKRKCVQDITDDLQMSALDVRHLAYDQVVFRRAAKKAKSPQGHAAE